MKFGTVVDAFVQDHEGRHSERGYIIGEMPYSDGDVFLVANEHFIGCPYNKKWLSVVDCSDARMVDAVMYRNRYLEAFPGVKLKKLKGV